MAGTVLSLNLTVSCELKQRVREILHKKELSRIREVLSRIRMCLKKRDRESILLFIV
jgi:hypothetical protein